LCAKACIIKKEQNRKVMIRLINFIIDLNNADIPYFFYGLIRVLPGKV